MGGQYENAQHKTDYFKYSKFKEDSWIQEKKDQTVSKEEGTYTFYISMILSWDFISDSAGMDPPLSEEQEDVERTDDIEETDDVENTDDVEGTDDVEEMDNVKEIDDVEGTNDIVVPGLFWD